MPPTTLPALAGCSKLNDRLLLVLGTMYGRVQKSLRKALGLPASAARQLNPAVGFPSVISWRSKTDHQLFELCKYNIKYNNDGAHFRSWVPV